MTDVVLARVDQDPGFVKQLSNVVSVSFLVIGLILSGSLLNWAVSNRLAQNTITEGSSITATVRERQLGCLAKNIYHEAGSEPFEGKVAVAQVTLNRAASGQYSNDICKVIFQKNMIYEKVLCQFSWVCDRETGVRPVNKAAYEESMSVAKKVLLEDFRLPGLNEALFYHADYISPGWKKTKVAKIGRHIFYK